MDKLLQSKQEMEKLNKSESKKVKIKPKSKSKDLKKNKKYLTFEERHTRMTTYIQNELHQKIQKMKEERTIKTITALMNNALKEYIKKNY